MARRGSRPDSARRAGRARGRRQVRRNLGAIWQAARLGEQVLARHPEVAERYRAGLTYREIAATIPELAAVAAPKVAWGVIGYAVRALLRRDDLPDLAAEHRRRALARTVGGFGTESGKAFSSRAGRRRIELYGVDTDLLTRAKGLVPWGEAERRLARELAADPAYRHALGVMRGRPAYARIAAELNRRVHGGRAVRTVGAVKGQLRAGSPAE